jgi:hypothetical protein
MIDDKTILYGGKSISVTLRNGSTAEVALRLIYINEIERFLDLSMEEEKGLLFCIESPKDLKLEDLTDDSYDRLIEENKNLNFTRALARSRSRLERARETGANLITLAKDLSSLLMRFSQTSHSPASPAEESKISG